MDIRLLFAGTWAFLFAVYGMNYIFSITLSTGAAQMCAVVSSFLCFCIAGVYKPDLWVLAGDFGGRGWMIPAISPIRWFWAFLITAESHHLSPLTRQAARDTLWWKGY